MSDLTPVPLLAARERLILALDFPFAAPALDFLVNLRARSAAPPRWVKVGLELFLAEGPSIVRSLRAQRYSVFLDLKLHDIPNTVASAVRSACVLGVQLLTIHAAGGPDMMRAAVEALGNGGPESSPRLLAVTVLTSMDQRQLAAIGVDGTPGDQVLRLAEQAWQAGVHGLVASPLEAPALRQALGSELSLVVPGIRPQGTPGGDDQQRIATPRAALLAGASQLVIGRPITSAADPAAAYTAILHEIAEAEAALRS